jgi:prepilin peptidase CpaA
VVVLAAVWDARFRRIPNWISGFGVVLGIGLNAVLGRGFGLACEGLLLALGVYLILYLLRATGAGDVKLMGAVGALAGWQDWVGIFCISAILGGVAAVLAAALRGRTRHTLANAGAIVAALSRGRAPYRVREELDVRSPRALRLPHGVIIACGTIGFLVLSGHLPPP